MDRGWSRKRFLTLPRVCEKWRSDVTRSNRARARERGKRLWKNDSGPAGSAGALCSNLFICEEKGREDMTEPWRDG